MSKEKVLINTPTTISVKIFKFDTLEKLKEESEKLDRSWDELINIAIERLLNDIDFLRDLRSTMKFYKKQKQV